MLRRQSLDKKDTTEHFDVTEGSFDGVEVSELVGLYLLRKLKDLVSNGSGFIEMMGTQIL